MRVAVVTANIGGHDDYHPIVEQTVDADWIAYTDEDSESAPDPWAGVAAGDVVGTEDPRLAAKPFRMRPWVYVGAPYDFIIWIDANTQVYSPHFLDEAVACAEESGCALTTWAHPVRNSILSEVGTCVVENAAKYGPVEETLYDQVRHYREAGYPVDRPPLYATGTLVWNMSVEVGGVPEAMCLGDAWLRECERWTVQDQVSLPFVAWRHKAKVGTFPFSQTELHDADPEQGKFGNRWLYYHPHRRDT